MCDMDPKQVFSGILTTPRAQSPRLGSTGVFVVLLPRCCRCTLSPGGGVRGRGQLLHLTGEVAKRLDEAVFTASCDSMRFIVRQRRVEDREWLPLARGTLDKWTREMSGTPSSDEEADEEAPAVARRRR